MSDIWTKAKRSAVMSRIRGRGNEKTELRLVRLMRAEGLWNWRRHLPIPGRPDFAFRRQKVVVFGPRRPAPAHWSPYTSPDLCGIPSGYRGLGAYAPVQSVFPLRDEWQVLCTGIVGGCFWHGCPRCFRLPKQNRAFWKAKIEGNRKRDRSVNCRLRRLGG